ncbi:hypothetical protein KOAAANKH_01690 [Brevundimonas sp. NIBR10]|uniref:hypothetical protein n=1 Tax=Brevundimonas sp. NIBR10 TaxID=3015997 RepID=UPI0022F16740|nr:hypothetical protein [Brevundimonas sp. NIBR10]WGM46816.1 hypothetical protein KOAAANKH_01690 [Brevundimonas sp. NIBR10]
MTRDPITIAAYAALMLLVVATAAVGLFYHFGSNGDRFQPWIFPMCMATFAGALLVDRLSKKRSR